MRTTTSSLADHIPDVVADVARRAGARVVGLSLVVFCLVASLALVSWSARDPSFNHAVEGPTRNLLGPWGAVAADLAMQLVGLGAVAALTPPAFWGWRLLSRGRLERPLLRLALLIVGTAAAAGVASLLPPTDRWPLPTGLGGVVGDAVISAPKRLFGEGVGALASAALLFLSAVLSLTAAAGFGLLRARDEDAAPYETTPRRAASDRFDSDDADGEPGVALIVAGAAIHFALSAKAALGRLFAPRAGVGRNPVAPPAPPRRPSRVVAPPVELHEEAAPPAPRRPTSATRQEPTFDAPPPLASRAPARVEPRVESRLEPPAARPAPRFEPAFAAEASVEDAAEVSESQRVRRAPAAAFASGEDGLAPYDPEGEAALRREMSSSGRAAAPAPAPAAARAAPLAAPARRRPKDAPAGAAPRYEAPRVDMLAEPRKGGAPISDEMLEEYANQLEQVLEDFGVKGEIRQVHPGPVVTLYELQPPPGLKSSRVTGLADDIARSMSAVSARVAVVQGRNVIGIELPNARRETVYLREMLEARDFKTSPHKLAIALGKTIGGEPVFVDLAKMPHLLVAGTTGSGKSVAINTMILSLLYRMTPDQCRLIMVDPKMLELSVYDGIPHLLTPVVTDPKKAVVALKWAVREMEDRYKKMSKVGVRNIDGFNARVAEAKARGEVITRQVQTGFDRDTGELVYETETMDLSALPYIVVIVDEMADLMMVAGKDIEGAIQRLAQMARAAGIHLIMATQRPSVDVITGTIKANFPTRISFQVTSKIDSRTILGEQGAEQLLGQGDMLYMAGGGRISRVHGPFVSDAEVERVVAHLKLQGAPEYLESITQDDVEAGDEDGPAAGSGGAEGEETGDLYDRAVSIVMRDKRVSTSYIQRRLSVGYNKAASLIERMEKEGVVSAPSHSGKREILAGGGIDRGAYDLDDD